MNFLNIVISIIVFILIIGLIIIVHEFGHYIIAKRSGMTCQEFSIGMGPIIYKRQGKETLFTIRLIPIGGFVVISSADLDVNFLKGEILYLTFVDDKVEKVSTFSKKEKINIDNFDDYGYLVEEDIYNKNKNIPYLKIKSVKYDEVRAYEVLDSMTFKISKFEIKRTDYKNCFDSKSKFKRISTLIAGAMMNFLLALFIYLIYFTLIGVPNYSSNVIGGVLDGYNISEYIKPGDVITKVNGVPINSFKEFSKELNESKKKLESTVNIEYSSNGVIQKPIDVKYTIRINSIGISNVGVINDNNPINISGARVGRVAINYKEKNPNKYRIKEEDIITGVEVDGKEVKINNFDDLVKLFDKLDVASIKFKVLDSQNNYKEIGYNESAIAQTYGNELLSSQNLSKIDFLVGISPTMHKDFIGIIESSFIKFGSDFMVVFNTLKILLFPSGIRQVGVNDLTGVVGIFDIISNLIGIGILPVLLFMAMLSVNIGLFNLLPIPGLDGGKIMFIIYETLTGKKVNKKVEGIITNIFFFLLMLLFLYVTFNDVSRLIK